MRIRTRITSLVLALLCSMIGAVSFALFELSKIENEIQEITSSNIALNEKISKLQNFQLEQAINFERVLRFTSNSQITDASLSIPLREAQDEFLRIGSTINTLLSDNNYEIVKLKNLYLTYQEHAERIFELINNNQSQEAYLESLIITAEEENLRSAIQIQKEEIGNASKEAALRASAVQARAYRIVVAIIFLSAFLGLSLALVITRTITSPLEQAVNFAKQIAEGKTNIEIKDYGDDELGQLLRAMKKMAQAIEQSEIKLTRRAEELARSNADLEQFAYIASHDLQEPLRMVASYTQLLARRYQGKLDESADEFIAFAIDGVSRMKCLINDLLAYSRVGRGEEEFKELDLNKILENTLRTIKEAVRESGAEIISEKLPSVRGDAIKLEQLFQNLITNAIKFRSKNSPKIEISTKENETTCLISFKDNGIGIDPGYKERIFQIFQRLHGRSEYPGTGIGLAICKRIVEYHKGKIWVESNSGDGSTFFVELAK